MWPISSGTAGPIWLNFLLLALSWSRDGFRPKNPDPGSGFSVNPEKPILVGNYKIFLQKSLNFHVKNRQNNSDN